MKLTDRMSSSIIGNRAPRSTRTMKDFFVLLYEENDLDDIFLSENAIDLFDQVQQQKYFSSS